MFLLQYDMFLRRTGVFVTVHYVLIATNFTLLQTDRIVLSTNVLFKFDVSLPLSNRRAPSKNGRCYQCNISTV